MFTFNFTLNKIPAGDYKVQIYVIGYDKIFLPITVIAGETIDIGKQTLKVYSFQLWLVFQNICHFFHPFRFQQALPKPSSGWMSPSG
jgi:hypothetical protein